MVQYKLEAPDLSSFHEFLFLAASYLAELEELRDRLVQTEQSRRHILHDCGLSRAKFHVGEELVCARFRSFHRDLLPVPDILGRCHLCLHVIRQIVRNQNL